MNKTTNIKILLRRLMETKAETIKLGIDMHARDVDVAVRLDRTVSSNGAHALSQTFPFT